jgi:anti-anti-sigma factor
MTTTTKPCLGATSSSCQANPWSSSTLAQAPESNGRADPARPVPDAVMSPPGRHEYGRTLTDDEFLTVTVTRSCGGRRVTIKVEGEIDLATAPTLRSCIGAALETGMDVTVDTDNVVFMDGSGVRALEHGLRLASGLGRHFGVHPAGRIVTRLLVLTRTHHLLLSDAYAPGPAFVRYSAPPDDEVLRPRPGALAAARLVEPQQLSPGRSTPAGEPYRRNHRAPRDTEEVTT